MPLFIPKPKLYLGDCLKILPKLELNSIDLVLCDPPYGTTQNKWDSVIPLSELWGCLRRATSSDTAIVLTSAQPFTSQLILSNRDWFKYCWVWDKMNRPTGFLDAKKKPLKITEDICVFYRTQPKYNPQMTEGTPYTAVSSGRKTDNYGAQKDKVKTINTGERYPVNLLSIKADNRGTEKRVHPTQKPIALMEYLVKTYSNPGDTVLDFAMGSGTTGIACKKLNRKFIGIEINEQYFTIAQERIASA